MKTLMVNKNSWHYRTAMWGEYTVPADMCAYVRRLFFKLIFLIAMAFVFAVICGVLAAPFAWLAVWIETGNMPPLNGFELIGSLFWSIGGTGGYIVWREKQGKPVIPERFRSELAAAAWQSFHDKVCFRLDYK